MTPFDQLKQKGIEYDHLTDETKIYKIRLPWSNDEIADIINIEGELFPSCCADISAARDILISALREDRWIALYKLYEACEDILSCSEAIEHLSEPIKLLFEIKEITKDVIEFDDEPKEYKQDDVEQAIFTISRMTNYLSLPSLNEKVCNVWARYKLYDALKVLMDELRKDTSSLCGYGVYEDDKLLMMKNGGPAIFDKEEIAKGIAEEGVRNNKNWKVCFVDVSIHGGIQNYDEKIDIKTPSNAELMELAKKYPPPQSWYEEEY